MDIADRINQIIEHEDLSIAAFARKINVGDQTVRSVCVLRRNKMCIRDRIHAVATKQILL